MIICTGERLIGEPEPCLRAGKVVPHVASMLLRHEQGGFILQRRDDIPGIMSPNRLSLWGGQVEPEDILPEAAVIREIKEETNLLEKGRAALDALDIDQRYEGCIRSDKVLGWCHMTLFAGRVSSEQWEQFVCKEGQGAELVTPAMVAEYQRTDRMNEFTLFTGWVLETAVSGRNYYDVLDGIYNPDWGSTRIDPVYLPPFV